MSLSRISTTENACRHTRIERALHRLHTLLRLVELGAPADVVSKSDELLAKSLDEIEIGVSELFALYPRYRIVRTVRDAADAKVEMAEDQSSYDLN